ncbi:MAG: efflux RND transporter periplasmic adaptor subunit [Burkholderiales bacterium]|nr:efflux RND transporter periplasmic adaptor subunit [Burkholderiales bacterium]MDE2397150.1 efflux RND transporter periplasmic adaptor subunit [Burkholderiales bacterium]MDE2456370.1 efflux RND transporter periplasmic adaptor subunit [Burkholderiales bacterium]
MDPSVKKPGTKSWLKRAGLVAALAAIGWTPFMSRGDNAPAPARGARPAVRATLVEVAREDVPDLLPGVGTVQALASVTVKSRIDGQLESVGYREGQDVKAGQVLARLDARALSAQLGQVQAQKARDAAQLANARVDLERYRGLIKEDATTQQTLDTQRALVRQLEAALQSDAAAVEYARVQLGYTTIRAPISGRVGARLVDPGNMVHAADAGGLVVINQIDPISVVFTLPDSAVAAINQALDGHRKLPVRAYSRDGSQLLAQGELVLINNQIDTASGTVQLKARFANAGHALWPGQYVNVRLQIGLFAGAATVPASVIQRGQQGTFAYVIGADGKAQMRPVEVRRIQDGKAIVAKGLEPGETVVADGQYKVSPGVAVVAAGAASAAGAAK